MLLRRSSPNKRAALATVVRAVFYGSAAILLLAMIISLQYRNVWDDKSLLLVGKHQEPAHNNNHCAIVDDEPQKIFLDVGANRGDVLRIFYNLGQQPEDSNNRQWKFALPKYNPSEWRVIAFEASPRMVDVLHQLQQQYSNLQVHVPVAVWTADGQHIPLGIDDTTEEQKGWLAGNKHGEWGSSVFHNATDTVVSVPTLDLARFIRETVSCPHHDVLYLKMNIEGAEFPIVKHLMADGTLCWINHLDIYWHSHLMPEHERKMWKETFIPLVRQYITHVCSNTQIHVWGVH